MIFTLSVASFTCRQYLYDECKDKRSELLDLTFWASENVKVCNVRSENVCDYRCLLIIVCEIVFRFVVFLLNVSVNLHYSTLELSCT